MKDKWINSGFEGEDLKPHIEPIEDYSDAARIGEPPRNPPTHGSSHAWLQGTHTGTLEPGVGAAGFKAQPQMEDRGVTNVSRSPAAKRVIFFPCQQVDRIRLKREEEIQWVPPVFFVCLFRGDGRDGLHTGGNQGRAAESEIQRGHRHLPAARPQDGGETSASMSLQQWDRVLMLLCFNAGTPSRSVFLLADQARVRTFLNVDVCMC